MLSIEQSEISLKQHIWNNIASDISLPIRAFLFDFLISNEFYKIWTCFKIQAKHMSYLKEIWKKIFSSLKVLRN